MLVYLAAIVALGCYARTFRAQGGEGHHYFLAGNTLGWPVIGLAMFAANISTVHLVSFAETAYKYGMVYGNFEWMAGFTLVLLSLVLRAVVSAIARAHAAGLSRTALQPSLPRLADDRLDLFGRCDPHRRGALHGGPGAAWNPGCGPASRRFWASTR